MGGVAQTIRRAITGGRRPPDEPHLLIRTTIAIWHEGDHWLGECVEFGIGSFGETPDEAYEQTIDATCSYLNTLEELGERERVFAEKSIVTYLTTPADLDLHAPSEIAGRESLQLRSFELPVAFA